MKTAFQVICGILIMAGLVVLILCGFGLAVFFIPLLLGAFK